MDYLQYGVIQDRMIGQLKNNIPAKEFKKEALGAVYAVADNSAIPQWKNKGETEFSRFVKRYALEADTFDGKTARWTMASRGTADKSGNVSMIIPIIKDKLGELWTLFLEEARPIDLYRNGSDSRLIAFPAGVIGDEFENETSIESAVRELAEETGLQADKLENLSPYRAIPTSPGLTDESTNFFLAEVKDLNPVKKAMTDGVTRGWWFVPLKNVSQWLMKMSEAGKVATGQTLTGLMLAVQKGKIKL